MLIKPIVVFAYSFEHQKTYDFLVFLKLHGFDNVFVIAAPKIVLKNACENSPFSPLKQELLGLNTRVICEIFNYNYLESSHDDENKIKGFLDKNGSPKLAVISGARILKQSVISLFEEGVVNFHPGKIPETSGLDSFYWMIKNGSLPGTTVHFIDKKVDAGDLIFFHVLELSEADTPRDLNWLLYQNQLSAFKRFLNLIWSGCEIKGTPLFRPYKNTPFLEADKEKVLQSFEIWKKTILDTQAQIKKCYEAVKTNDCMVLTKNFSPFVLNYKNSSGRTLLAESAYYHSYDVFKELIKLGADLDAVNDKGTTVLMYAKTILLENETIDGLNFIEYILSIGGRVDVKDFYGRSVFDYIHPEKKKIISILAEKKNEFY
ncbi:hypothetical protein A8139_20930 [Marinomonas primoryensis]|uniref:Formyl transferase N-terminal domain-containing protein n=1 Tax=Marinomonas primoryensis TaxID=178399 RepID=A0A2Z4PUC2_9GAMM|nr:formyltransferase family protein [Marinomonas primoryensis]AWY01070.1 hypothetical protein A8139_14585 [Marinomonas primoryensis]AWY02125.1 hypothetical protein A8139_20930 [Marinomonas primoryensis]